jgi:hypothetical protein
LTPEQPRQLGDVRRDPKRCDAAIMLAIGGNAEVRDLRLFMDPKQTLSKSAVDIQKR